MKTSGYICILAIGTILYALPSLAEEPLKAPTGAATPEQVFAPGKQTAFQPIAVDPALVRQSMQARSEYEDLNRKIIARQTKLFEDNATIKDLQAKMREIQKKIDTILADDQELKQLKEKFKSVSPEMPSGLKKPALPTAPVTTSGEKKP